MTFTLKLSHKTDWNRGQTLDAFLLRLSSAPHCLRRAQVSDTHSKLTPDDVVRNIYGSLGLGVDLHKQLSKLPKEHH